MKNKVISNVTTDRIAVSKLFGKVFKAVIDIPETNFTKSKPQ